MSVTSKLCPIPRSIVTCSLPPRCSRNSRNPARIARSPLSSLVINVPADAQIDGLIILRDGTPVDVATWNRALPVDGDQYTIAASAPVHEPWSTVVKIGNAQDKRSVDVPRLLPLTRSPVEPRRPWYADRPGWALVGGGTVGVVVGTGFLVSAGQLYDRAANEDRGTVAQALEERGRTRVIVGGIIGGLGVATLAAGVIKLALNDPGPGRHDDLHVMLAASGVTLWGRF